MISLKRLFPTPIAVPPTAPPTNRFTSLALRTGERIAFSYLISNKYIGDECAVDILRDGQPVSLTVKLTKPEQLVPPHISNKDPSYFMAAGLVFSVSALHLTLMGSM